MPGVVLTEISCTVSSCPVLKAWGSYVSYSGRLLHGECMSTSCTLCPLLFGKSVPGPSLASVHVRLWCARFSGAFLLLPVSFPGCRQYCALGHYLGWIDSFSLNKMPKLVKRKSQHPEVRAIAIWRPLFLSFITASY